MARRKEDNAGEAGEAEGPKGGQPQAQWAT